jgi:hypothetical protein
MRENILDENTINSLWDEIVLESISSGDDENIKWLELAEDVVLFIECRSTIECPRKINSIVLDNVYHLAVKYLKTFGVIFTRLKVNEINYIETFYEVVDKTWCPKSHNWGRVLIICTFTEYLARALPSKYVTIGKLLGIYIVTRMGSQIRHHGGWKSFYTFCNTDLQKLNHHTNCYPNNFIESCISLLYLISACVIGMMR